MDPVKKNKKNGMPAFSKNEHEVSPCAIHWMANGVPTNLMLTAAAAAVAVLFGCTHE